MPAGFFLPKRGGFSMKKLNRTYVMGIVFLLLAVFIFIQTGQIPERLVSNEPGPKFFPYISAAGIAIFAILSMIFDGKKEAEEGAKPYLDKDGWIRMGVIMAEAGIFCLAMHFIGFWIASMLGTFMFTWTLKRDKKGNLIFAIVFAIALGTICYFGFTRGFHIPLPSGAIWKALGIKMP